MHRLAYWLRPRAGKGFHLGREGLDSESSAETFPSDSLFAAVIATLVGIEGPAFVEQYMEEAFQAAEVPAFRLSSAFPFAGSLPLFPVPKMRVEFDQDLQPGRSKWLKKLAYVSPVVLSALLAGQPMNDWLPTDDRSGRGVWLQGGKIWIDRTEIDQLPGGWRRRSDKELLDTRVWDITPVPRVTVDRVSNLSAIYHVGRTTFASECGLWVLAEVEQDQALLEDALDHLADQGIGGERAAGYGAFEWQAVDAPDLPASTIPGRVMTLSRYHPTREELAADVLGPGASYDLVLVGGWLASPESRPQRRKRVRMVEAGSVLNAPRPLTGDIVDVRPDYDQPGAPDHPVFRSGIALTIGVPGGI